MQESIKFIIPEGYELDAENSTDTEVVYKLKIHQYSVSWEEFCRNNQISFDECYIRGEKIFYCNVSRIRYFLEDRDIIPKRYGKAMLALMQLLTIREKEYIPKEWIPGRGIRIGIFYDYFDNTVKVGEFSCEQKPLSFPNRKLAETFLSNWRDLLEQAKELI